MIEEIGIEGERLFPSDDQWKRCLHVALSDTHVMCVFGSAGPDEPVYYHVYKRIPSWDVDPREATYFINNDREIEEFVALDGFNPLSALALYYNWKEKYGGTSVTAE